MNKNLAMMGINNTFDDYHAQPRASGSRSGLKRPENIRQDLWRHANAGIGNIDTECIFVSARIHRHGTAIRHRFARIFTRIN